MPRASTRPHIVPYSYPGPPETTLICPFDKDGRPLVEEKSLVINTEDSICRENVIGF